MAKGGYRLGLGALLLSLFLQGCQTNQAGVSYAGSNGFSLPEANEKPKPFMLSNPNLGAFHMELEIEQCSGTASVVIGRKLPSIFTKMVVSSNNLSNNIYEVVPGEYLVIQPRCQQYRSNFVYNVVVAKFTVKENEVTSLGKLKIRSENNGGTGLVQSFKNLYRENLPYTKSGSEHLAAKMAGSNVKAVSRSFEFPGGNPLPLKSKVDPLVAAISGMFGNKY